MYWIGQPILHKHREHLLFSLSFFLRLSKRYHTHTFIRTYVIVCALQHKNWKKMSPHILTLVHRRTIIVWLNESIIVFSIGFRFSKNNPAKKSVGTTETHKNFVSLRWMDETNTPQFRWSARLVNNVNVRSLCTILRRFSHWHGENQCNENTKNSLSLAKKEHSILN